jgi:hypothetical protein
MKSSSTIHQTTTGNSVTKMTLEFEDWSEVQDVRTIMDAFIGYLEGDSAYEVELALAQGILDAASVPDWVHDSEDADE